MRAILTLADREDLSRGLAEGLEYRQIAVLIGRDPSVMSREAARRGGGRVPCRSRRRGDGRLERTENVGGMTEGRSPVMGPRPLV